MHLAFPFVVLYVSILKFSLDCSLEPLEDSLYFVLLLLRSEKLLAETVCIPTLYQSRVIYYSLIGNGVFVFYRVNTEDSIHLGLLLSLHTTEDSSSLRANLLNLASFEMRNLFLLIIVRRVQLCHCLLYMVCYIV